jgi:sterol desaturase/sphingolipid hydroxylase (fatty acid hydroxylase superfamily)
MEGVFSVEVRDRRRKAEVLAFGPRYSPLLHWLGPLAVGLVVAGAAIATLDAVRGLEWLAIPVTFLGANAAEWRIHRDLLHRPSRLIPWLYDRHTLMHHRVFVEWDMDVRSRAEWGLVLIPPAAVIWLVGAMVPPALVIAWLGWPDLARLFLVTAIGYVLSYEALHLAYHQPSDTAIGRLTAVRWLRRHHAAHHHPAGMGTSNFNVSFPLWDRVRGTMRGVAPPAWGPPSPTAAPGSAGPPVAVDPPATPDPEGRMYPNPDRPR